MSPAITDLNSAELETLVADFGGKPFQARQLAHWIYKHGADSLDACRNVPKVLRQQLAAWGPIRGSVLERTERSNDGTEKYLIRLADGEAIESVLIPDGTRRTLCISTQVGCPVACVFCASGLEGVRRNLTAGEIVEQVLHARERMGPRETLTNVVVMGMGEPMLNLPALIPALERLHDADGIGLGARRITVSTSGYPDRIAQFAQVPHPYQLAISLHAGDNALRKRLVPTATASVDQIVRAATKYGGRQNREVTFEIVLLATVNDRHQDAEALVQKLRRVRGTVNLIPWNPVDKITSLHRPAFHRVDQFAAWLRDGGLRVTVRRQRGAERDAACGQLRLRAASAES